MSTAAGLGALGEGIIRGMKLGSDMNDAEQRRGLMGLQMKREQAELQKQEQLSQINKAIADEVTNFKPAGPDDVEGFNGHYERLTPLIMQQAALTGQNPALVRKSINDLRRGEYAERLYDAVGSIQAGDASGFEKLKPVYNQMFKDKGTLLSGAYDQKTDSILINYRDVEGKDQSMNVPRETFVRQALGYANFRDAVAFDVRDAAERKAAQRKEAFESGQLDKRLAAQKENTEIEQRGAMQRTNATVSGGIRQAEIGRESRINAGANAREERNEDDVVKGLPLAFGYDPKNQLQADGERDLFSARSSQALSIYKTTKQIAKDIPPPDQFGLATIVRGLEKDPKTGKRGITKENIREIPGAPGYFAVDYKGVQAVVPPGIISK